MKSLLLIVSLLCSSQLFALEALVPLSIPLTNSPGAYKGSLRNKAVSPATQAITAVTGCIAYGFTGTFYAKSVILTNTTDSSKDVNVSMLVAYDETGPSHSIVGMARLGTETCTEGGIAYQYAYVITTANGNNPMSQTQKWTALTKIDANSVSLPAIDKSNRYVAIYNAWCGDLDTDTKSSVETRDCLNPPQTTTQIECMALFNQEKPSTAACGA